MLARNGRVARLTTSKMSPQRKKPGALQSPQRWPKGPFMLPLTTTRTTRVRADLIYTGNMKVLFSHGRSFECRHCCQFSKSHSIFLEYKLTVTIISLLLAVYYVLRFYNHFTKPLYFPHATLEVYSFYSEIRDLPSRCLQQTGHVFISFYIGGCLLRTMTPNHVQYIPEGLSAISTCPPSLSPTLVVHRAHCFPIGESDLPVLWQ